MTTKRECEICDKTTTRTLSDFYLISWYAFNIGNGKAKCYCSEHYNEFQKDYKLKALEIGSIRGGEKE